MYTNETVAGRAGRSQVSGRRPVEMTRPDVEAMQEDPPLRITLEDIQEANRLSLACPICSDAVQNHVAQSGLWPVICRECGTLYHRVCWDNNGGHCAVLGCDSHNSVPFGQDLGPTLVIRRSDIPRESPPAYRNRTKRLKAAEQARTRSGSFWQTLLRRIWRAFGGR